MVHQKGKFFLMQVRHHNVIKKNSKKTEEGVKAELLQAIQLANEEYDTTLNR